MNNSIKAQAWKNKLKGYLYISIFTTIVCGIGTGVSYYFNWGLTGTSGFLLVTAIVNFFAYYYADKIILRISKARPITQEQAPDLYQIVTKLCEKINIPLPKLYLLNENTMNAFATGRSHKHSSIAVTKGLLSRMTPAEVEAVLAHELSHVRNNDMRLLTLVSILTCFINIIADLYWSSSVMNRAQDKDSSGYLAILAAVFTIFTPLSAFFLQMAISRKRELVADAASAQMTGNPKSLISALKKIALDVRLPSYVSVATSHLYFSQPSQNSLIDKLFSTHPHLDERIKLLEKL